VWGARGPWRPAYLFKWRKDQHRRVADARAAKDAERVELEVVTPSFL